MNHSMEEFVAQRLGQKLGERWLLQSVLGVGGMAAVYAATDAVGREVAVKVLHPEIGMRPEIRDRFMREGYIANRIDHPGAVRVLEHGAVDDWSVFLVMERLQGESLGQRVSRLKILTTPELLDVLDQVLDVLAVAHAAGIVHRDLKPDNLFISSDGTLKVLDFGIAKVMESAPDDIKTRTGMAMGTLPFMAPEQALGKRAEIDGRVDIFAMGATAFRILAQRRVHEADSDAGLLIAMATKPAPPLRSVVASVPENVAAIIDLALAFSRDARYPDARTMQNDIRAVRRGEAPPYAAQRTQARNEATRLGTQVAVPAAAMPGQPATVHAAPPLVQQPTVVGAVPVSARPTAIGVVPLSSQPTLVGSVPLSSHPTIVAPPQAAPQLPMQGATIVSSAHAVQQAVPAQTLHSQVLSSSSPKPGMVNATVAAAASPAQSRALTVAQHSRGKHASLLAGGVLLVGGLAWALWPSTETEAEEPDEQTRVVRNDTRSEPLEGPSSVSESASRTRAFMREQSKNQREQAREQQKRMEEAERERGKKSAEKKREREKRN